MNYTKTKEELEEEEAELSLSQCINQNLVHDSDNAYILNCSSRFHL
jgi:hypothetical protein